MVPPPGYTGFTTNPSFSATRRLERMSSVNGDLCFKCHRTFSNIDNIISSHEIPRS